MSTGGSDTPRDAGMGSNTANRRMITQRDIAERCGIHQTTVSLALRGDSRISEETRAHILAIAADMGYDPSLHTTARRLAMQRFGHEVINHVIALSMSYHFMQMQYYSAIFRGLVDGLIPAGFALVITYFPEPESPHEVITLPSIFHRGDVDGMLFYMDAKLFRPILKHLRETPGFGQRPLLSLVWPSEDCSAVMTDDRTGAYESALHLLGLGHRHFLQLSFTSSDKDHRLQEQRWDGIRQALREYGLDPNVHFHLFEVDQDWMSPLWLPEAGQVPDAIEDNGHDLVHYLEAHPQVTAIFGLNDSCALQAWYRLNRAGYQIPEDISIVGFDDVDPKFDEHGQNMLTSVRLPLFEVGRGAARLIIGQVNGKIGPITRITLPTQLIIRSSTGPAKPRK